MSRSRKNEAVREQLLDIGVAMFIDQGFHGTGIQEVVDQAGIPKGSFYNYFKSKEDFGAQAIIHYSDNFKEFLQTVVNSSKKDAAQALSQFFDNLIKLFNSKDCKEGCLLGNFAAEISDSSKIGRETMSICVNEWKDILKELIIRGQEQGHIKKGLRPDDLADFFLNFLEGSILRMKIEGTTAPLEQMRKTFNSYALISGSEV
jgi:TetR/AcrR family transcriptional regulator, transcriptional repressor for nem operon